MAKKKQNKYVIYVVLIALAVVLLSNFQQGRESNTSPVQVTARYYDANGNLIGTSGRGFSLQSIISPDINTIPAETYTVQLVAAITNTGNANSEFAIQSVTTFHDQEMITVGDFVTIVAGQTANIPTVSADVHDSYENSEVQLYVVNKLGDQIIDETYRWRYNKPLPIGCEDVTSYKANGFTTDHFDTDGCEIVSGNVQTDNTATTYSQSCACYPGCDVTSGAGWEYTDEDCKDDFGDDWEAYGPNDGSTKYGAYCGASHRGLCVQTEAGVAGGNQGITETCYQEHATISDFKGTDGNCDLDYSGSYDSDHSTWYDIGLGQTVGLRGEHIVTYKKPTGAISTSQWKLIKAQDWQGYQTFYVDLDANCWNAYHDRIILKMVQSSNFNDAGQYCYDGESWIELYQHYPSVQNNLLDEGMNWEVLI